MRQNTLLMNRRGVLFPLLVVFKEHVLYPYCLLEASWSPCAIDYYKEWQWNTCLLYPKPSLFLTCPCLLIQSSLKNGFSHSTCYRRRKP